jgi:hypothetical protein
LRFSWWWFLRVRCSGLWRHVIFYVDTDISEESTSSVFRVKVKCPGTGSDIQTDWQDGWSWTPPATSERYCLTIISRWKTSHKKISSLFWPVKNDMNLKALCIYKSKVVCFPFGSSLLKHTLYTDDGQLSRNMLWNKAERKNIEN